MGSLMAGFQTRWPAAPLPVSPDLQFQPQSLGMCRSRSESLMESHILHKIFTKFGTWNFSWFEVYQTGSIEATQRPVPVLTFSPISSFAAPTSCLSLGPGLGLGETHGEAVTKSVVPPIRVALSEVEYTPGYNWQIV